MFVIRIRADEMETEQESQNKKAEFIFKRNPQNYKSTCPSVSQTVNTLFVEAFLAKIDTSFEQCPGHRCPGEKGDLTMSFQEIKNVKVTW
ncbi:hypothetical protein AVEN_12441-1 [Araneus ventricosus]|uniref:Uncharacterized protein n=1 Tax=Araneus ventricosus TaxID=182803 RepID=A0A4Y2BHE8_ARAVE|nr:hypothetical protein AVEN_12441-1 [Araneus ventricosus]